MYEEVFEGMNYTNKEIADMFNKTFVLNECDEYDGIEKMQNMVVVRDIDIFSYCEHHLALMYDMKVTVAYIPKDRVIGISKIARIADMVSKRLQLQERIGTDIADIVQMVTGAEDIAVFIEGCHSCMTARGIKKVNAKTYTQTLRGKFQNESRFKIIVMPKNNNYVNVPNQASDFDILFNMMSSLAPSMASQSPIKIKHIDIGIKEEKLNEIEVMMGPETTEAERYIVEMLLSKFENSSIKDSYFKGKIKSK